MAKKSSKKYVYFFGSGKADGKADMKNLLGGKGANLAEMTNLGIPVPPGFTSRFSSESLSLSCCFWTKFDHGSSNIPTDKVATGQA